MVGKCPLHSGRKSTSFYFYPNGERKRCFWKCYTQHCEESYKGRVNIIGFVQAVLSHDLLGWEKDGDPQVSWQQAIDYVCECLNINFDDLKYDPVDAKLRQDLKTMSVWNKKTEYKARGLGCRQSIRKHLEIPAKYYLEKGFSPEILDAYDVGYCRNENSEQYGRIVFPVYAEDKDTCIGVLGRSVHKCCPQCNLYHPPALKECPKIRQPYVKWLISTKNGFNDKHHLYSYWNCRDLIFSTKTMVICEGPGDTLKARQAGIYTAVGLFGSQLSDAQQAIIECSGATTLVILTDNDEAGDSAYRTIKDRCLFQSKIVRPKFDGHDIGELSVDYVRKHIKPQIDKLTRR